MITAPKQQHAGLSAELWVDLCNAVMQFGLGLALEKHLWPGMLWAQASCSLSSKVSSHA